MPKITALPPAAAVTLDDLVAIVDDPSGSPVTKRAALNQIIYFTKVLTAYIGGDQTGNARGADALDIQSGRLFAYKVASGNNAIAVGYDNVASGGYSVCVGAACWALGYQGSAFGSLAYSSGSYSTAVGLGFAYGYSCTGIGASARSRIDETSNLCGPLINRKDNGENSVYSLLFYSGAEIVMLTKEIDLKTIADTTITLPTGASFFPNEVGVIVTSANTVTIQPTLRFGYTGTPAGLVAATPGTGLTSTGVRNRFTTLITPDARSSILGGVTIGATATTLLGRFYFSGMLIENE